jgi:hypothetical protein
MGDSHGSIVLLKADHKEVAEMLEKFETARSTKGKLAQQICQALTVHAQIEEEISIRRRVKRSVTTAKTCWMKQRLSTIPLRN